MKKLVAFMLALTMAFGTVGLTGCGGKKDDTKTPAGKNDKGKDDKGKDDKGKDDKGKDDKGGDKK